MKIRLMCASLILCTGIIYAQAPVVAPSTKPKIISIADLAKYKLMQLELGNAVKDVEIAQLQAQQTTQQIIDNPIRVMNAKIADALRSLGVNDSDILNWVYDPNTKAFIHREEPKPQTPDTNKK